MKIYYELEYVDVEKRKNTICVLCIKGTRFSFTKKREEENIISKLTFDYNIESKLYTCIASIFQLKARNNR